MIENPEPYKITILDRLVLFRHKILSASSFGQNKVIFVTEKYGDKQLLLKFSYPGNIQFHQIRKNEIEVLITLMESS